MKNYKKITIPNYTTLVKNSITCDVCGNTYYYERDFLEIENFLSIDFVAGYGSYFGDMNRVEVDMCSSCSFDILKNICRINNRPSNENK